MVGHFNVKFLVGDPDGPDGPRGFFRFYRDQWDEALLGPKPVSDPLDFLEKDRFGKPLSEKSYGIGGMREYWACLNNPNWRQVLKAWVRCGLARGVDGFISNYFYRHDCHCAHCVAAFRLYLRDRFTTDELESQFAIHNLATHEFDEIVGWHDPAQSSPLRREMLRFSQIANKRAFDEVFIQFGRSLKPDLIVAQWNHLGDFSQINGDERCLLPDELWGRNEDYLWYSTGGPDKTDLAAGVFGEATLQARYIRGAFHAKPFTLGKYENVRVRAAIAELLANGGAPMGFYTDFEDAAARRELGRYYGFVRRNEMLYRANRSYAEVLLLFPRTSVHQGELAPLARFKQLGKDLLDRHILFDVQPDDLGFQDRPSRSSYRSIINPADKENVGTERVETSRATFSRFKASATVRVSASYPAMGGELDLHFVNYNRHESANRSASEHGIADENPIPASSFEVDLVLPTEGKNRPRAERLEFLTPERDQPEELEFHQTNDRVRARVPEFLVYGVVRIQMRQHPHR